MPQPPTLYIAVDSSIIFNYFSIFNTFLPSHFLTIKKKLQFYHHPKMCKSFKMWEKLIYGKFETRRASENKELWTRSQPRACNVCKTTRNADFKSTRSWMLAGFQAIFLSACFVKINSLLQHPVYDPNNFIDFSPSQRVVVSLDFAL